MLPRIATRGTFILLLLAAGVAAAQVPQAPPSAEAAAEVDRLLAEEVLRPARAEPAPEADDATFMRRISLDLVGELATPQQVTALVLDPAPDKRQRAVDRLLADQRFGLNWARYWRDVVMSRSGDLRGRLASGVMVEYLSQQFNDNTSWGEIARDFITARGDVRAEGRTALISAQLAETADVAAEVSRVFLGIQIQCAQCHDHPTDRWTREQFHQLAAFFPRLAVRPVRDGMRRTFELVSIDDGTRGPRRGGQMEHYMPDLDDPAARGTLMQPVFFLSGEELPVGSEDEVRRRRVANWITARDNPWFARAFVNRLWSELVGEGFYEPVDDLGPDREAAAQQTLDYLAAGFTASGYDVKWLFRTIMATRAYQRESRPRRAPNEPAFAATCPQRLRGDQLASALGSALGVAIPEGQAGPYGDARGPRGAFNSAFGFDPSLPRGDVKGSIPQALLLMNSPTLAAAIDGRNPDTALGRLLADVEDDEEVVLELYLRCLARQPADSELETCLDHVRQVADRPEAFEDILWALINSTEFLHRK